MEVSDVAKILAIAKIKQAESELEKLSGEIGENQRVADDLSNRKRSVEAQINSYNNDCAKLKIQLSELEGLKGFISEKEFAPAKEALTTSINDLERNHENALLLASQMNSEIATLVQNIDQLRDRRACLTDPYYRPKYKAPKSTESYLMECRTEIVASFQEISRLREKIAGEDLVILGAHLKIASGLLRKLQDRTRPHTASEEIIFRRSFGTLCLLVKELSSPFIDALNQSFITDWNSYVSAAKGEIATRRNILDGRQCPSRIIKEIKNEIHDTNDIFVVEAIVKSNVLEKTRGLKLATYGGSESRNRKLGAWIKDALQLQRIHWYSSADKGSSDLNRLQQSINSGGVDALLIFTQWSDHPGSNAARAACKVRNIPVIMVNSSSKKEICIGIAKELGYPLNIHETIVS